MELPACALTTPDEARCRTSKPVAAVNDTEKQTLTAQNVTLSTGAPTVLAAVAEASSEKGTTRRPRSLPQRPGTRT
ncbi:hypothetical protein ACR6C2_16205 [Streptomyces sp. INA 01156]